MTAIKPAENALTDAIVDLLDKSEDHPLSEFEIARAQQLIAKLDKLDIASAHSYRGCLYSVLGRESEAIAENEAAFALLPNALILHNYASSLIRLGKYDEAKKKLMLARKLDKTDPMILYSLIDAIYAETQDVADLMATLPPLLEEYEKLVGKPHKAAAVLKEDAEDAAWCEAHEEEWAKEPTVPWEKVKQELGL
jgi:tetratricopeptide (TPR) repeat protein